MTQSYNEDLKIGDRIGRYEILSIVGSGSMGMVYKCRHDVLGRVVAIKTLRLRAATDERTQKRFVREAQMANRLDHPNLISLIDFGNMANGDPYLVMEFVSGESLHEVRKQQRYIIPERVVHLFSQVCDGLYHAHQRGVIHRDLKPANILVIPHENAPETVKIVDLGVAKIVHGGQDEEAEAITMTGEVCGSPIYLSPEQCMYQELDARTDIYSIGVCMYECLTGVPPLRGASVYDTIYMHVHDTPRPFAAVSANPDIPRRLEEVVFKCLSKAPNDRYETMMQLKHDLINSLKSPSPDKGINVLPPESLFTQSGKKPSGESAKPKISGSHPAMGNEADESGAPIEPRPRRKAAEPLPPRRQPAPEPNYEPAARVAPGPSAKRPAGNKSAPREVAAGAAPDMTKMVVLLSVAFLLIGSGIGFGFAFLVNKGAPPDQTGSALKGDSKDIKDGAPLTVAGKPTFAPAGSPDLPSEPLMPPAPAPDHNNAGANGKKTPGKSPANSKTGKASNSSGKKAEKPMTPTDMSRLLDSDDGSQSKYFSIVKNNLRPGHHLPRAIPMPIDARGGGSSPALGNMQKNMQGKMKGGFAELAKQFIASQSGGTPPGPPPQGNPLMAMMKSQGGGTPAGTPAQGNPLMAMMKSQGGGAPFGQQPPQGMMPPQNGGGNAAPFFLNNSAPPQGGFGSMSSPAPQGDVSKQNEERATELSNEGTQLLQKGANREAYHKFDEAFKLAPSNAGVRKMYAFAANRYGVQLNKEGKYAEAVALLKKAVNLAPDNELYHKNFHNFSQNLEQQKSGQI